MVKKAQNGIFVNLPTVYGEFRLYMNKDTGEDFALVMGNVRDRKNVLVRVHSECITGEVFGSLRCDCGEQLQAALKAIRREGLGVLVYLRQEGRGIGFVNKVNAYHLQDKGSDTVDANKKLGFEADGRDYKTAAKILDELGVASVRLLTNNPEKEKQLKGYGVKVTGRLRNAF